MRQPLAALRRLCHSFPLSPPAVRVAPRSGACHCSIRRNLTQDRRRLVRLSPCCHAMFYDAAMDPHDRFPVKFSDAPDERQLGAEHEEGRQRAVVTHTSRSVVEFVLDRQKVWAAPSLGPDGVRAFDHPIPHRDRRDGRDGIPTGGGVSRTREASPAAPDPDPPSSARSAGADTRRCSARPGHTPSVHSP